MQAFIPPLIAWFAILHGPDTVCDEVLEFTVAYSGILATYSISFMLELWTIVAGLQGTPLHGEPRRVIPLLVVLDTICHIVQVGFVGYLSYLGSYNWMRPCDVGGVMWNDDAFTWATAGTFWTYCLFYLVFVILAHGESSKVENSNESWSKTYMNSLWMSLIWLGWNPFSKTLRDRHRERAERVGKNLKSLFGHSDMTLSDFILGFAYARHKARHSKNRVVLPLDAAGICSEQRTSPSENRTVEDLSSIQYCTTVMRGEPVGGDVLQEAEYYFRFAMAAYGWMMYMLGEGFFKGIFALCWGGKGILFPMFRGKSNLEIACRVLDAPRDSIVFIREQGQEHNVLCYVISVDHDRKRVIVSVRGAVTISDNVRDVLLEPAALDAWVESEVTGWESRPPNPACTSSKHSNYIAQGDYLEASRATLCDILESGVLQETVTSDACKDYQLVFTGHSLGAACCFFLALYFQKFIPDIKCWCFSPPLGLVDKRVAERSSSWCTTIVCGKELPPRFSAAALDLARDQIIYALASVKLPKLILAYKLLWSYKSISSIEDDLQENCLDTAQDARDYLNRYLGSRNSDKYRRYLVSSADRMTVPGSVIYFQPVTGIEKKASSTILDFHVVTPDRDYEAIWIENECLNAQGLIFSGRFLADHMPDYAEGVIQRMAASKESNAE